MNAPDHIPLSGVIEGMRAEDYHAAPGLSNSGLSVLSRSPFLYYSRMLDPARPPEPERGGQLEGTLAHCAILEPGEFDTRYRVGPQVSRATKAWKEAEELACADGVQLIKPDQYEASMHQGAAVRILPQVRELLEIGRPELSAFANDPRTGVLKKCRPDWTHYCGDGDVILMDVKTYSDASPAEFARQIARKGYYRQAAHYWDTYQRAAKVNVLAFVFVAVETEWPYQASAVMLDDAALEFGRRENERLTELYAQCLERNKWPGYGDQIALVSLPRYITNPYNPEEE